MKLRFRTLVLPLAACGVLLTACGDDKPATDDPNLITFNDFESVLGWQPYPDAVTREHAHSGKYAITVGPGKEFTLGYALLIGKALARKPHKIRIEGWGYMTDGKATARLGLQVLDPATGKETFGDGVDFASVIKVPKKWVEISKDVTLPDNVTSAQELRVFIWRANAESPAYFDDMRVTLLE